MTKPTIARRIDALEGRHGSAPVVILTTGRTPGDPNYYDDAGRVVTDVERAQLAETHTIILVTYTDDWRKSDS